MLIGRTDDPQNPRRVAALEVTFPFGCGSRNPSGPAAVLPQQTGRTHDRFRTRSDFFPKPPCIGRAVHTRPTLLRIPRSATQRVIARSAATKQSRNQPNPRKLKRKTDAPPPIMPGEALYPRLSLNTRLLGHESRNLVGRITPAEAGGNPPSLRPQPPPARFHQKRRNALRLSYGLLWRSGWRGCRIRGGWQRCRNCHTCHNKLHLLARTPA
jgi:hypothetical protein